jgi:hypothetical protein
MGVQINTQNFLKKLDVYTVYSKCIFFGIFSAHLAHTSSSKLRPNLELANTSHPEITALLAFVPSQFF